MTWSSMSDFDKRYQLVLLLLLAFSIRVFFIEYFGDVGFEPDSYLHFLFSQSSFARLPTSLNYAVGVWAKPLFTLFSGFAIWVTGIDSLWIVKLLNASIWLLTGGLVYRFTQQLGLTEAAGLISVILTEFSFLGFRASIGSLTEPLFTFFVLAASVSLYAKHYRLFCLLVSLSILVRSEGLVLLPVWTISLWFIHHRRRLDDLLLIALFPVLWNAWGYIESGDLTFIITSGYPISETHQYGQGTWIYYLQGLLQYEPLLSPLAFLGIVFTVRESKYLVLHVLISTFFVFNVVAWRFGLFGTAGLLRYFVPVIPWMAVYAASAFSFNPLVNAYRESSFHRLFFLFVQMAFTIFVVISHTEGYNLYNSPTVHHALIDAGRWIHNYYPDDYLYSSHPAVLYYADRDFYTGAMKTTLSNDMVRDSIVAFEDGFGSTEFLDYLRKTPLLKEFGDYVFLYDHSLTSIRAEPLISFQTADIESHLRGGWSNPETWGTWAEGRSSEFALHFADPQDVTITLVVIPHFVEGRKQSLQVYYNDMCVAEYEFPAGDEGVQRASFHVSESLMSNWTDVIRFEYGYAVSPFELGDSDDKRALSVGFLEMRIAVD